MTDVRQTTIDSLNNVITELQTSSSLVQTSIASDMKLLQTQIAALKADMLANPVPATTAPVVVAPTGPVYTPVMLSPTNTTDVFQMAKVAGTSIVFGMDANGKTYVQFQPPAAASAQPSSVSGTQTPGTAAVELLINNLVAKDFSIKGNGSTLKQLRTSGAPNAWECFWLFFNVHQGTQGQQFNYIAFKPNGIEIGKGYAVVGQTFLWTTTNVKCPIGVPFSFEVVKLASLLTLKINGMQVTSQTIAGLFDVPGSFALYSEDALVAVSDLQVKI